MCWFFQICAVAVEAIQEGDPPPGNGVSNAFITVLSLPYAMPFCNFIWIPRASNMLGHTLCAWARSESVFGNTEISDLPLFVTNYIINGMPSTFCLAKKKKKKPMFQQNSKRL